MQKLKDVKLTHAIMLLLALIMSVLLFLMADSVLLATGASALILSIFLIIILGEGGVDYIKNRITKNIVLLLLVVCAFWGASLTLT